MPPHAALICRGAQVQSCCTKLVTHTVGGASHTTGLIEHDGEGKESLWNARQKNWLTILTLNWRGTGNCASPVAPPRKAPGRTTSSLWIQPNIWRPRPARRRAA